MFYSAATGIQTSPKGETFPPGEHDVILKRTYKEYKNMQVRPAKSHIW